MSAISKAQQGTSTFIYSNTNMVWDIPFASIDDILDCVHHWARYRRILNIIVELHARPNFSESHEYSLLYNFSVCIHGVHFLSIRFCNRK
jgi:hypothetical protein